jgi:hypothetical protein
MLIDLQDFGGELPSLDYKDLPTGNATYAMDVDFGLGTLKPFQTDRKASDVTGESIWSDDCCYLAGDCNTTFAQADIGCQYVFKAGWRQSHVRVLFGRLRGQLVPYGLSMHLSRTISVEPVNGRERLRL